MLDVQIRGRVSSYLFEQYFPGNVGLTYCSKTHLTFSTQEGFRDLAMKNPLIGPFNEPNILNSARSLKEEFVGVSLNRSLIVLIILIIIPTRTFYCFDVT